MNGFGFTADGITALLFSITCGISALGLLVVWNQPHDCGNRYCPHRKARSDEEEDRRFWGQ
jgi:hypothetical protein